VGVPDSPGHKWFTAWWNQFTRFEPKSLKRLRRQTLEGVAGRVLEIGCGNGANFALYPDGVSLVASDPDPYMLTHARNRPEVASRAIEVHEAGAEVLPFEDASFDAVVSTLVLCSVPDQRAALAEITRVLKPGGALHCLEHVRYAGGFGAWFQDRGDGLWARLGGGCHPNRDTAAAIEDAGFTIQSLRKVTIAPPIPPLCITRPGIRAVAVRG
jgi:SAM-dependent methyltransferase